MDQVTVKINGIETKVPAESTILEAAHIAGIRIPTLCYLREINAIAACRICLVQATGVRGHAAAQGRDYATPDDVKAVAPAVLAHRLLLRVGSNARTSAEETIRELLADVPVPVAR